MYHGDKTRLATIWGNLEGQKKRLLEDVCGLIAVEGNVFAVAVATKQLAYPLLLTGTEQVVAFPVAIVGGSAAEIGCQIGAHRGDVAGFHVGKNGAEACGYGDFLDGVEVGATLLPCHAGQHAGMVGHSVRHAQAGLVAQALLTATALGDIAE